jgi:hypothetical protein
MQEQCVAGGHLDISMALYFDSVYKLIDDLSNSLLKRKITKCC